MNLHLRAEDAVGAGSVLHRLPELRNLRVDGLLPLAVEEEAELTLGRLELRQGQTLPLHRHDRPETIFVLSGAIEAQRGQGAVELVAPAAAYFPANIPHGITARGEAGADVLVCHSHADRETMIASTFIEPDEDPGSWQHPNRIIGADPQYRWALAAEYEPWTPVEPTKGWRLRLRYLFDPNRGAPAVVAGMAEQDPDTHYTLHRHEPPELYHVISGSGTIHVGDASYPVTQGSTVYVPANVRHGIDTGIEPMQLYWVYGLERCGPEWVWEADEKVLRLRP